MKSKKSKIELLAEKLKIKRWDNIRSNWIRFIPNMKPAGYPPELSISNIEGFQSCASRLSNGNGFVREHIPGIQSHALLEAIFLLHKASHVLSAAELHIKMGVQTWSLSSAYQASFYSAKSILNFIGINIAEFNKKSIVCDLWPEPDKLSKTHRNIGEISDSEDVVFWKTGTILDHKSIWLIFQRIIRVTRINLWPDEYVKSILKLNVTDFAKQRNSIHYSNNKWPGNDLFDFVLGNGFGTVPDKLVDYFDESYNNKDFTVVLSFIIFRMAYLLLKDLSHNTNKLNNEIELIISTFQKERHPMYCDQLG